MSVILVSACLVGCECRYKGDDCRKENIAALAEEHTLVPVCPEQLGGLPTPRTPSERQGDRVVMKDGTDVTQQYRKGAETVLKIAKLTRAECAILKARSPSCGSDQIYDGTFTGTLIPGSGTAAELLKENGFRIFTEENFDPSELE